MTHKQILITLILSWAMAPVLVAGADFYAKDKFSDSLRSGGTGPQMVVIPAGSFMMGSPETDNDARDDERPQHKVTIAKPFAVSRFEVTFAEWNTCIDAGGCEHRPSTWLQPHGRLALPQHHTPTDPGWCQGARPVINVSWDDITSST